MSSMTPSSISIRSTRLGRRSGRRSGGAALQSTSSRRYSFSDLPSGQSKRGISCLPSSISTSQRSAISSVRGERLRHVGERRPPSPPSDFRKNSFVLEAHLRLRERRLRLHAQQRRVVVVVLLAEVVHVGGRDQRAAHLGGEAPDRLVDLLLLVRGRCAGPRSRRARARRPGPARRDGRGPAASLALDDPLAAARGQAAGEADDALGVPLQQLEVDAGLAAVQALEEAGARELDQVAKPVVALRQQRQVVALDLAAHGSCRSSTKYASSPTIGLMPCFLRGLVELDRAVHDAVVGEPERRLAEARRALGELVDLARAVEQRVLGVDVEMGAAGRRHGPPRLCIRADGTPPRPRCHGNTAELRKNPIPGNGLHTDASIAGLEQAVLSTGT